MVPTRLGVVMAPVGQALHSLDGCPLWQQWRRMVSAARASENEPLCTSAKIFQDSQHEQPAAAQGTN